MTYQGFSSEEDAIVDLVTRFVEERVRPSVQAMEKEGRYPLALVQEMKDIGLFGSLFPKPMAGWASGFRFSLPLWRR